MTQLTPEELILEITNSWVSGISVSEARTSLLSLVDALDTRANNDEEHIYISPTLRIGVWIDTDEDALTIERYNAVSEAWELGGLKSGSDSFGIGATSVVSYGDGLTIKSPIDNVGRIPVAKLDVDGVGNAITASVGSQRNPADVIRSNESNQYAGTDCIFYLTATEDEVVNTITAKSGTTIPTKAVSIMIWKGHKTLQDMTQNRAVNLVFKGAIDNDDFISNTEVLLDVKSSIEFKTGDLYTVRVESGDTNPFSLLGESNVTDPVLGTNTMFVPYFKVDRTLQTEVIAASTSNVLELDNTTVFVPTLEYHPVTKKYVDDLVATYHP